MRREEAETIAEILRGTAVRRDYHWFLMITPVKALGRWTSDACIIIDDTEMGFYRHREHFWGNLSPDWEIKFDEVLNETENHKNSCQTI